MSPATPNKLFVRSKSALPGDDTGFGQGTISVAGVTARGYSCAHAISADAFHPGRGN
jgi:hypothetical protein